MGCGIGDDWRCVSGWSILRLSNTILGCFTCYEGLFRQISVSPILHATNSQSVMPGCIRPRSIQGPDKGDHYASKSCIHAIKECLLTTRKKDIWDKYARTGWTSFYIIIWSIISGTAKYSSCNIYVIFHTLHPHTLRVFSRRLLTSSQTDRQTSL